jgi:hypothetical protein
MGTLVVVDAVREVRAEKRAAAGAPDSPRLVKAASINVMATAATAPSLRTIGIMAPPAITVFAGKGGCPSRGQGPPPRVGHDEAMTDKWSCQHFSLANPLRRGATDLPKLLRRVATEIEKRDISPMDLLDLTIHQEMTGDRPWWSATVYWSPDSPANDGLGKDEG